MTLENLKDFDRTLFGTKVLNLETKKLEIVLYTWTNVYADGNIPFATCVNENGKRYNIEMDSIIIIGLHRILIGLFSVIVVNMENIDYISIYNHLS